MSLLIVVYIRVYLVIVRLVIDVVLKMLGLKVLSVDSGNLVP